LTAGALLGELRAAFVEQEAVSGLPPIWRALVTFDEHARDGVRGAVPLAILMTSRRPRPGALLARARHPPDRDRPQPGLPDPGGGLTTIGAIVLAGEPTGDIAGWAGKRVVDVLVGCAIALVATYLFWPKGTENETPVPAPT
jgi:hypothetical protein